MLPRREGPAQALFEPLRSPLANYGESQEVGEREEDAADPPKLRYEIRRRANGTLHAFADLLNLADERSSGRMRELIEDARDELAELLGEKLEQKRFG